VKMTGQKHFHSIDQWIIAVFDVLVVFLATLTKLTALLPIGEIEDATEERAKL
jgi:hypothetical protein